MGIKEALKNFGQRMVNPPKIGDQVDDRELDSLKRQWQKIENKYKKEELKQRIAAEHKKQDRENVWGMKEETVFEEIKKGKKFEEEVNKSNYKTYDEYLRDRQPKEKQQKVKLETYDRNIFGGKETNEILKQAKRAANEEIRFKKAKLKELKDRQKSKERYDKKMRSIQKGIAKGLEDISLPSVETENLNYRVREQPVNDGNILNTPYLMKGRNLFQEQNNVLHQPFSIIGTPNYFSKRKK